MEHHTYSKEVLDRVRQLRLIDDAMFRVVMANKEACEEMLRVILDDPKLKVLRTVPQQTITSFQREITMDVLCELGDGTLCNTEVQKESANNDPKRTRFHASALTTHYTKKGDDFSNIPNVCIVYISEYDALGNNQAFTEIRRCQKVNGRWSPIHDGERICFVNATIDDGSNRSKLMQLFLQKDISKEGQFQKLSNIVSYYKNGKGVSHMCKVIEEYAKEYAEEYAEERDKKRIKNLILKGKEDAYIAEIAEMLGISSEQVDALRKEVKSSK